MSGAINGLIQKVEHFGFAELQGLMEAEAGDIASRQEDSERSRKSLIELTMQFRQETPEESRRLAVPVLKRYQTEMDQLCERSKAAENAYLSIYTKLITLPDIPALLEYCRTAQQKLSQLADLQTENSELKTTLNDSNRELQHVRHQDVIIKQLKEEVKKYETSQTETVERLVQQAEQRLLRQFEEREHVLQDEQLLLSRQLTEAQLKSAQLSSDLDLSQNQLMELKTKFDEITGARSDEYDLLTDELARSDERAAMAEREVNSLKEQLAASHKSAADDPQLAGDEVNSGHRTVDLELAAKEKEISHLIEDVGRLQCRLTSLESQSISQRTQLEEQLAQRNKIICRLEHVLDRQKDYNEVKKELEIMKSIEFPGVSQRQSSGDRSLDERESEQEEGEEEGVGGSREGDEDRGERGESDATTLHRAAFDRPLEMLLMEKNRRLQHTNTTLKNSNAALQDGVLSVAGRPTDSGDCHPDEEDLTTARDQWSTACGMASDGKSELNGISSEENDDEDDDGDVEDQDQELRRRRHQRQGQSTGLNSPGSASGSDRPDIPIESRHSGGIMAHDELRMSPMNATSPMSSLIARGGSVTPAAEDPGHAAQTPVPVSVPVPGVPTSPAVPVSAYSVGSTYRYDENDPLIPKSDPMETRLQEMLRYNMERYGGQCLDTLQLARRVRELLSVNNIGQRMFARYILGLSQGTVSELLSKPKSWDKLTEKGRDSYRKMHAWAVDEAAVFLLKTIIPKKGKDCRSGMIGRDEDQPGLTSVGSDERIAHILSEASSAMRGESGVCVTNPMRITSLGAEDRDSPVESDKSPGFDSRDFGESATGGRPFLADTEMSAQERIATLYQEHLAKLLAGQRAELAPPVSMPMDPYSRMRSPEELRLAMDIYNQELLRHMHQHLKQQQQQNTISASQTGGQPAFLASAPDCSLTPTSASVADVTGRGSSVSPSGHIGTVAVVSSNSTFDGDRPPSSSTIMAVGGGGGSALTSLAALRAARQSEEDVNAAVQSNPAAASGFLMHAAAAAALASGTVGGGGAVGEDLTTTSCVSSTLGGASTVNNNTSSSAGVSPLQRMASITNSLISSASASSASLQQHAPRPMKAVLPPITQHQFDQYSTLNTEDIVKRIKEHLSQFSISQRLFGESVLGLSQGSVSDLLARPKPWHMLTQKGREPFIRMQMFLADDNAVHKLVASQYKIAPEKLMRTGCYNGGYPKLPLKLSDIPRSLDSSPLPASGAFASSAAASCLALSCLAPGSPAPPRSLAAGSLDPLAKYIGPGMRGGHPLGSASMSVYETAAITPELDTQLITTRIKEVLLANNIGQKLFGEVVLGLSQGSVSELLSKPKPWHLLSIKGREPFIRMKMWLEDARNVDKLQRLKCERKENNKRRRCQIDGASVGGGESSDGGDLYSSMVNSPNAKKARVLFTDEQKEALRLAFTLDPYPNMAAIEFLSHELSLTPRTITNWFHNHRMRLKQQQSGAAMGPTSGEISPTLNGPAGYLAPMVPRIDGQPSASLFDPIQFRVLLNGRLMEMQKERGSAGSALAPTSGAPGLGALSSLAAAAAAAAAVSGSQLAGFPGATAAPLGFPYFGSVAPGAGLLTPASLAVRGSQMSGNLESLTGLDLSIKSDVGSDDAGDDDEDVDGPAGSSLAGGPGSRPVSCSPSEVSADTYDSSAVSNVVHTTAVLPGNGLHGLPSSLVLPRSSRRKPAAPQWVNPQWLSGANSSNHQKASVDTEASISSTVPLMASDRSDSPTSSTRSPLKRERISFSDDDEGDDPRGEVPVDGTAESEARDADRVLTGSDSDSKTKLLSDGVKCEINSADDQC